ncbi:hypothetical protein [Peribacillus sp. NPDC060253]|uniref:hypothetical protein n=1 Tax=Peribacillus sp. NPDC060253 TaxID=3347084 RepID=UPI003669DD46
MTVTVTMIGIGIGIGIATAIGTAIGTAITIVVAEGIVAISSHSAVTVDAITVGGKLIQRV